MSDPMSMPALTDALANAIHDVEAELAATGPIRQDILRWLIEYAYRILERAPMPDIDQRINATNEQSCYDGLFTGGVRREHYDAWVRIAKDVLRRVGTQAVM